MDGSYFSMLDMDSYWMPHIFLFLTGTVIGLHMFFSSWQGQLLDGFLEKDSYWMAHIFIFLTRTVIRWRIFLFSWQEQLLDGAYFYFFTGTVSGWRIFLFSWQGQLLDGAYFYFLDRDSYWMAYIFLSVTWPVVGWHIFFSLINKRKASILAEKLRHQVNG
jgi:hypothetical protein